MSVVLLIFLGLIKLTFVGYEQAQADGAAFVAAHAAAMETVPSLQQTRGQLHAYAAFPGFPNQPAVQDIHLDSAVGTAPWKGALVAYANRKAGGLFLNQGFGGSAFDLHSHVVEPVVAPSYVPGGNLVVNISKPPACMTNNNATSAQTAWACNGIGEAKPDPKNNADPFHAYACHLAYFASLTNDDKNWVPGSPPTSAPSLADIQALYPADASNLTDGAGHPLTQKPWPDTYQFTSDTPPHLSINFTRDQNTWLTSLTDGNGNVIDSQQNAGGTAKGGLLGTQLIPIFEFGGPNDKCP